MFFNPMGLPRRLFELLFDSAATRYSVVPQPKNYANRGKGKGGSSPLLSLHASIGRGAPEHPRHWHNPSDPIQAARIEAAREKRERKANRLYLNVCRGWGSNRAHAALALDPFHVVRS